MPPSRSVRFDPALDERVPQAAAREGVSVSGFIRTAAARADGTLGGRCVLDAGSDHIGSIDTGERTDIAHRHHGVSGDIVAEKHARPQRRPAG